MATQMLPHIKKYIILALIMGAQIAAGQNGESGSKQDIDIEKLSKVKAAFIYNFIKFTTWPDSKFADAKAPLKLVIVGNDEATMAIESTLSGRDWKGHTIVVEKVVTLENSDLSSIHLVYIGSAAKPGTSRYAELNKSGSLTVASNPESSKREAILGFIMSEGKVAFTYNATAAQASPLQISSKLLSLAKAVN